MGADFKDELKFLNRLNEDDELFKYKFNHIKGKYPIKNCNKVYGFIKDNRGLIIVLDKVEELLLEYVPYASQVYMELDEDPLFTPQLILFVRVSKKDFGNGFKKDIRKIDSIIDPLLFKLDLALEFFIFEGSEYSEINEWNRFIFDF